MENAPRYLSRFAELYERQGRQVALIEDKLWVNYNGMVVPIGPINMDYSISEEQAQRLIKQVPGALLVRYTRGYQDPGGGEEWYAVVCDKFNDLGLLRGKHRWEIKRGLKRCEIRQVDAGLIAGHGYDVYASAFSRYTRQSKAMGKNDFNKLISATRDFEDIYHYWGVFHQNNLIAYSMVAIYGEEEADISVCKFNPEYLNLHPHISLIFILTKHYLSDLSIPYVNAGFRNINHKTEVQQLLIKKLLFKKAPLKLEVTYNSWLNFFLRTTYPLRSVIKKMNYKLGSLYLLEEIRKNNKKEIKKPIKLKVEEIEACSS